MFDPSKIDLDLENLNKKDKNSEEKTKKEDYRENETKLEKNENNKEYSSVMDSFNNPILKDENKEDIIWNWELIDSETRLQWKTKEERKEKNQEEDKKEQEQKPEKVIYDINITSISDLIKYSINKEYDYFIIEPLEDKTKISFIKNKTPQESKYIRLNTYNEIVLKAKTITRLKTDEVNIEQEWEWEVRLWNTIYKALSKTIPWTFWEKLYFRLEKSEKKAKKEAKKTSINQILGFMGAALFSLLLIAWVFLSFILLNSNNVADLTFFNNLWVDVWSIRDFVSKVVDIVFFSILFIETIFLAVFTFKAILTKKEYKKQRINRVIISIVLLILVFLTATLYLTLSKKIKDLNGINYWKIEFYDNWRYLSNMFGEAWSIIDPNESIIWPISIRFNTEEFIKKLIDDWFNPKTVTWIFEDEEVEKPIKDYEIIKSFNSKWLHRVSIKIDWTNIKWEEETKEIEVASFNIQYLVDIEEKIEKSWWKRVSIYADDLKDLWKVNWYYIEEWNEYQELKTVYTWYEFHPGMTIFNDVLIWIRIWEEDDETWKIDQIFVISWVEENNINWEIEYEASVDNDLEYTLKVNDPETDFWAWYIEKYTWLIDNKVITKIVEDSDSLNPSEITFDFKTYWEHQVQVELTDSAWNTKTLTTTIKIDKQLKFKEWNTLEIYNNWSLITDYKFEEQSREYYIDDLWVPTTLKFDASQIRAEDYLYSLEKVEWDTNNDWNIDEVWKTLEYDIHTGWNYIISIKYSFKNKKINETIEINEKVYISAVKKDVMLDLEMIYSSDYAPVSVAFDASKSQIKDKDIAKFIYDYGDGSPLDERDAKNPWHKYNNPWDYTITLTVVTTDWSEYSISKTLILKPEPQKAEITASRKNVSVFDWIDFSSEKSVWQISNYFWDFWDWETSLEANPNHFYKKAWTYTVKLIIDFKNKNTLSDEIDITVNE